MERQPGEFYGVNKQCEQAYGPGSRLCPYKDLLTRGITNGVCMMTSCRLHKRVDHYDGVSTRVSLCVAGVDAVLAALVHAP